MALRIPPVALLLDDGAVGTPTLSFSADPNTGMYRVGGDLLGITAGGTAQARFDNGTFNVFSAITNLGTSANVARLRSAGTNGGIWERTSVSALITLNTGGTTTDSASIIPADCIVEAVTYRVTTTITTAASFSIGDATTAARFVSGATGLTAGTTGVGLRHWQGSVTTDAAGPVYTAASVVRITTNANPGAGAIRVQVWYRFFTAPTS